VQCTADFLKLFAEIETLVKAVNASACVNKLLLAGKERMALGANIYTDIFFC
jgi:hypothetical protein